MDVGAFLGGVGGLTVGVVEDSLLIQHRDDVLDNFIHALQGLKPRSVHKVGEIDCRLVHGRQPLHPPGLAILVLIRRVKVGRVWRCDVRELAEMSLLWDGPSEIMSVHGRARNKLQDGSYLCEGPFC